MNGIEEYGVQELSQAELELVNGGGWFDDLVGAIVDWVVDDIMGTISEIFFGYRW